MALVNKQHAKSLCMSTYVCIYTNIYHSTNVAEDEAGRYINSTNVSTCICIWHDVTNERKFLAEEGYKMYPNAFPYIIANLCEVSGMSQTLLLR